MTTIFLLLLIVALVCFVLAAVAVKVGSPTRAIDLVALGLAFWVAVDVIQKVRQVT